MVRPPPNPLLSVCLTEVFTIRRLILSIIPTRVQKGSSFYTLAPFPVRKNHTQRSFTGRPKTSRAAVAYNSS